MTEPSTGSGPGWEVSAVRVVLVLASLAGGAGQLGYIVTASGGVKGGIALPGWAKLPRSAATPTGTGQKEEPRTDGARAGCWVGVGYGPSVPGAGWSVG